MAPVPSVPGLRSAAASAAEGAAKASNSSAICTAGAATVAVVAAVGRRRRPEILRRAEAAKPPADPADLADPAPIAIPFLGEPGYRRYIANCPGDAGFDPANFAGDDIKSFINQREAELKHCRLAMLAAVGWPLAELDEQSIAKAMNWNDALAKNEMAPSLLNGGLLDNKYGALFLGFFLVGGAIIDLNKPIDSDPGDYEFDPLKLEKVTPPVIGGFIRKERRWMAEAELKNGRLAMIGITAFVAQEFVSKIPVVAETPALFGR